MRPDSLSRGLGYDELYSASHFILGVPWTTAATGVGVFNNHPGYSVAAWVSTQLLGPEEWVVRLPAFLLGLVGVLATWLCARQVLPRWAAVAAAALLALSPEWGLWSRSARGYTGAATFAMLAVFFWHHTRASGRRGASVALGASLAVSVWMHLYAVWIMVAMASVWVTDAIRPARTSDAGQAPHVALAGLLLGVAGALAVYAPLADGLLAVADGRGRGVFTQAFVIGLVTSFAGGSDWWVVAGTGILATLGALRLWVRDRALGMLVIAAIAVPLFMLWSAVTPRDLYSRFFVYWLPMLSLLMAAGLHVTWTNRATRVPGAVLAAVLIAAWIGPATTTLETTASFRSAVPPAIPGVPTLVFGADGSMLRYYAGPIAAVTSMEEIDDAWERVPELRVLYHNVAWNTPDIVALAAQLRGRCDHRTEGAVVAFTCR
ncbi:MAG: glycosyltransferase family 39 protein [Acidobacteria bacterium]|nr:glycosyltransferase family 39 protein [Acidobacteriota bacterium]